jgi:hypothetical protein
MERTMMKRVLKGIAVGLALLVVTLFVLYVNRIDPYGGLPGKRIRGEEVTGPVEDWSFAVQYGRVTVEVRPSNPYSVFAGFFLMGKDLYISSAHSRWAQLLRQDPDMRIRVGDKIYLVSARQVEDLEGMEAVHKAYTDKYPNRTPEEAARRWFFRLESR